MKLKLVKQVSVSRSVKSFVFEPEEPASWQAGQFIEYNLPQDHPDSRGERRWFTISSAPYEKVIQISTRIDNEHGSSFKKALLAMRPGSEINAKPPEGDFVVDSPNRNFVFVAGGIGITPFHSIIKQLDHDGQPVNIELLWANRDTDDIPFKEELEAIAKKHGKFHITYFIGGHKIDGKALKDFGAKVDNPIYFVSGPEPMVEAFKETLDRLGVDDAHSKYDYFPGYQPI